MGLLKFATYAFGFLLVLGLPVGVRADTLANPDVETVYTSCTRTFSNAPDQPVGVAQPNDLAVTINFDTPATTPGARTVSTLVANCLYEKLGRHLLVLGAVSDTVGPNGAIDFPMLGLGREFTDQEKSIAKNNLELLTRNNPAHPILVYCHNVRCGLSYNAVYHLRKMGYTRIFWMRSGLAGWDNAHLPFGYTYLYGKIQIPKVTPPVVSQSFTGDPFYPVPPGRTPDPATVLGGLNVIPFCNALHEQKFAGGGRGMKAIADIEDAAGVDPANDSSVVAARKARAWWIKYGAQLKCNDERTFRPVSPFKVALRGNPEFIKRAVVDWQLPGDTFNIVDTSDGRTVLDYAASEANDTLEANSRRAGDVYSYIYAAGGRSLAELVSQGKVKSAEMLQQEYISLYKRDAAAGDIDAMLYLSGIYFEGWHAPKNRAEGRRWQEMAEQQILKMNDFARMAMLARNYFPFGLNPERENADLSLAWAKRSAAGGNVEGKFWLGKAYVTGVGGPVNAKEGLRYLLMAQEETGADQYIALAYIRLGDLENAGRYLRTFGELMDVGEHTAAEWLDILKIPTCGPRKPGWGERPCGQKSAADLMKAMTQ